MVDEYTCECPQIVVGTSLPSARVIAAVEQLAARRGLLHNLVVDHGPEFTSRALDIWAYRRGVELAFIRPGKPVRTRTSRAFTARFGTSA